MAEFFQRVGLAFKCFFLVLFAGRLPDDIPQRYWRKREPLPDAAGAVERTAQQVTPPEARSRDLPRGGARPPETVEQTMDRAVQLLALLQRDGRLVDFLTEDIAGYPDDQVGAAVREVHASCRQVLDKYVGLEPVLPGEEGRPTVVEPGFDVACIKLVGSVTGTPPFRGILRHKGWRARRLDLPTPPSQSARNVIAPAEVEIE